MTGRFLIEMHRLRVKLGGKGKRLLARDVARSECAETAGREIFEGQHHDGDSNERGLIVAVICGNLNPPARMGTRFEKQALCRRRPGHV